jgi:hypothetical protein
VAGSSDSLVGSARGNVEGDGIGKSSPPSMGSGSLVGSGNVEGDGSGASSPPSMGGVTGAGFEGMSHQDAL